ncbi:MAG: 2-hydroxyglutaryl-CoA dehydratase [Chitinivibrionales bacterium]|nr:2-hydroxyglutaryl-CoA dehydratase [Chitinivibrionales bacterium]
MITCGVDIGSRTIEIVLCEEHKMIDFLIADTGAFPTDHAKKACETLLQRNGLCLQSIKRIVATGYGRNYFTYADRVASEIVCHAAGVAYEFPGVRTIIDIGGQDSKMIQTNENGKVINFVMNDRCAAGTGKFIEMVARTLDLDLAEVGSLALTTTESCDISSMCAVFAESEIIGLLHRGASRPVILRGVFKSVARRTIGMAATTGLADQVVFTGGVALNKGVVEALEHETGKQLHIPTQPQITGALGAAIIAYADMITSRH